MSKSTISTFELFQMFPDAEGMARRVGASAFGARFTDNCFDWIVTEEHAPLIPIGLTHPSAS